MSTTALTRPMKSCWKALCMVSTWPLTLTYEPFGNASLVWSTARWIELAATLGVDGLEFYSGFVDDRPQAENRP